MKSRVLIIFTISFLILPLLTLHVYSSEPVPVGVTVVEYGIFDADDNNTHQLIVGEKYNIKIHFKSDLERSLDYRYFVQIIDKNKGWPGIVKEFDSNGILQPNESKFVSFTWTPKYEGEFRTYAGVSDNAKQTMVGNIPQYDFDTIRDKVTTLCGSITDGICINPDQEYFDTVSNQILLFVSIGIASVVFFVIIWRNRK